MRTPPFYRIAKFFGGTIYGLWEDWAIKNEDKWNTPSIGEYIKEIREVTDNINSISWDGREHEVVLNTNLRPDQIAIEVESQLAQTINEIDGLDTNRGITFKYVDSLEGNIVTVYARRGNVCAKQELGKGILI